MAISSVPSSPIAARARDLLNGLPDAGTAAERREQSAAAVDSLVREYGSAPEASFGRLAQAMGAKSKNDVTAEAALRSGLRSAASGASASGTALAGMAVAVLAHATPDEKAVLTGAAVEQLKGREDLAPVLGQADLLGFLPGLHTVHATPQERERAQEIALEEASRHASPEEAAQLQLQAYPDLRFGKLLLDSVYRDASPQEQKSRAVADALLKQNASDPWQNDSSTDIISGFLSKPSNAKETATVLAQLPANQNINSAGDALFESQLEAEHDPSAPYLKLALNVSNAFDHLPSEYAAAANRALLHVGDGNPAPTPQQIAGFGLEASQCFVGGGETIFSGLKAAETLPSWKAAASMLEGQYSSTVDHDLGVLQGLKDNQSPLLAVLGEPMAYGTRELGPALNRALGLTSDPHEVSVLRQASDLVATKGADAATAYIRANIDVPATA